MYDSIIIGMGPAGISCATYLKRYGLNVLVIGKDLGALELAKEIENFYGVGKISGHDLALKGIKEAMSLGINICHDEVINIDYLANGFNILTKKNNYDAKTIVLATGKVRNSFTLAKNFEGKGVSYCATCDGFFYRKKEIAIIGYNSYMLHELNVLLPLVKKITVFTDNNELEVQLPENVEVVKDKITSFKGNDMLEQIVCGDKTYNVEGCFIALGSQNAFTLAKHLGLDIKNNNLVVNDNFMTNIPGIFACGDVIGGMLQVAKAVSDGAICANNLNNYIRELKK